MALALRSDNHNEVHYGSKRDHNEWARAFAHCRCYGRFLAQ